MSQSARENAWNSSSLVTIKPSDILLNDRVAVVTGGGAGIGRGIAAGMAAFGASVAIWEHDADSCAAAAEAIGALGIVPLLDTSENGWDALYKANLRHVLCAPNWSRRAWWPTARR